MAQTDNIRVLLCVMTGFGNNAVALLSRQPHIRIIGAFVPEKCETPFPYYECEPIHVALERKGIPYYEGSSLKEDRTVEIIAELAPDLMVVSSFNQIIPQRVLNIPRLGVINLHPSLLPEYRGATPTTWALINGERETGVTAHFVCDTAIDSGPIISQSAIDIGPDETDGMLRQKLAALSEDTLNRAIELILLKDRKEFPPQDESIASHYPKRSLKDAEIDIAGSFSAIKNRVRAMTPYPGASLSYQGRKYIVDMVTLPEPENDDKKAGLFGESLIVITGEGRIKFHVAGKQD